MAVEHYCDYCGQLIEGLRADMQTGRFGPTFVRGRDFDFCAGTKDDHENSCFERARKALIEMKTYAHRDEGSTMEWKLVERPGRTTDDRSKVSTEPEPAPEPLPPVKGKLMISAYIKHPAPLQALRRAGIRTIEEAAERSEFEIAVIDGAGPKAIEGLREGLSQNGLAFREGPDGSCLGRRLREAREARGISRSDVARAIDAGEPDKRGIVHHSIHEGIVGTWETGKSMPGPEWLERLAAFFDLSVERLLEPEVAR